MIDITAKEESEGSAGREAVARSGGRLMPGRLLGVLGLLFLSLCVVAVFAAGIGSERIAVGELARIVIAKLSGSTEFFSPEHATIIWDIRVPRLLMAIVVGGGLSVAGAAYQALLRNPLADPYILGVSTGAAVGAIGATILASSITMGRPACAFAGAMATMAVVYVLGQGKQGAASERLILAGVIINALLSSVVIFLVTTAAGSRQRSVLSWLIGDLSGDTRLFPLVLLLVAIGIVAIFLNARSLNLIMTGEEEAAALGVEVTRVKMMVFIAASLMTGAVVAVSGVIGFVGLIIPHAVRMLGGSDNRLVVPASALAGGAFLLVSDTVARTIIAPSELHIGVITALIGAPVFVFLLRRTS